MAKKNNKQIVTKSKDQIILDLAFKRLKIAVEADRHNRSEAIDDLNFVNGDQWDPKELKKRKDSNRPALMINLLPKYIDQVVGDERHNRPRIKVRPVDSKADISIAKIREGIISNIEYLSNSAAIYDQGFKQAVTCGFGAWRVLTRYTEENPFLQEIYLKSIPNPLLVYMDPSAKDQNYADAKWGFLLERMNKDEYDERYPNSKFSTADLPEVSEGLTNELTYDDETVTVAEYFSIETVDTEVHQLDDGQVVTKEEFDELHLAWEDSNSKITLGIQLTGTEGAPEVNPAGIKSEPKIVDTKTYKKPKVVHRIINAFEILSEEKEFPGKYVPLVLLKGKELNIEGKTYTYSLIRHAKDSQKLINYWNTTAAETIALAPKAPWIGTPKQFEGFEGDYANANNENFPFLQYNPDSEAQGPPVRTQPGQPPVAVFEQIRRGEENLKSVLGMFNADVGDSGSEQTGVAITNRQRPGDIGTFEFLDNLNRAVVYTGRIINEIIPTVYDTERDVRLRNIDETESFVPINTTVGAAVKAVQGAPDQYSGMDLQKLGKALKDNDSDAKFNDITVGKYDVVVTAGPSYATQRQESAMQLLQLVQAMPQQMATAADIIVQNLDFKDSDILAERLRKMLPPGLVPPKPGDPPAAPPKPSPEEIAAQTKMQLEQSKMQLQQMKVEQEKFKLEAEKMKIELEIKKLQTPESNNDLSPEEIAQEQNRQMMEQQKLDFEKEKFAHQKNVDLVKAAHEHEVLKVTKESKDKDHEVKLKEHEVKKMQAKKDPLKIRKKD